MGEVFGLLEIEVKEGQDKTLLILAEAKKVRDWIDNEEDPLEVDHVVNTIADIFRESSVYKVEEANYKYARLLLDDLLHVSVYKEDSELFENIYNNLEIV